MKGDLSLVVVGVGLGVFLLGTALIMVDGPFSQSRAALKKCEETLPRNLVCRLVITAAPEKEGANDE